MTQIAKDFGISEGCLHNWMKKADVEDGARPGPTAAANEVAARHTRAAVARLAMPAVTTYVELCEPLLADVLAMARATSRRGCRRRARA